MFQEAGHWASSEVRSEICSLSCLSIDLTIEQSENIAIACFLVVSLSSCCWPAGVCSGFEEGRYWANYVQNFSHAPKRWPRPSLMHSWRVSCPDPTPKRGLVNLDRFLDLAHSVGACRHCSNKTNLGSDWPWARLCAGQPFKFIQQAMALCIPAVGSGDETILKIAWQRRLF